MGGCSSKKPGSSDGQDQIDIKLDEGRARSGTRELLESYKVDEDAYKLYIGNRSEIMMAPSRFDMNFKVVIKMIHKNKLEGDTSEVAAEFSNLSKLDHPYIVKFFECYDSKTKVYLVMEYVQGVSLAEKI